MSLPLLVPSCPECKSPHSCTTKPGSRDVAVVTANGKWGQLQRYWYINRFRLITVHFDFRSLGYEVNSCGVQCLPLLVRSKSGRLFCFWLSAIIHCRWDFILSHLYWSSGLVLAFSTQTPGISMNIIVETIQEISEQHNRVSCNFFLSISLIYPPLYL